MKKRFDEDQAELEAHFAARVQAYRELGETPEQAQLSARAKFGQPDVILRKLRWQKVWQSPIPWAMACASGYLLMTALNKSAWLYSLCFFYALYFWREARSRKRQTSVGQP